VNFSSGTLSGKSQLRFASASSPVPCSASLLAYCSVESDAMSDKTRKAGGRPFQKGVSGNPGGRRKQDYRIKDLAQKHTTEAIATLRSIMKGSDDDRARVAAANAILDRGYGKPAQSVDVTNSDGSMSQAWLAAMRAVDGEVEEQHVEH
jgi:hypothetical protein